MASSAPRRPRPSANNTSDPLVVAIGDVRTTMKTVGESLNTLSSQTTEVLTNGPSMGDFTTAMQGLSRDIKKQEIKQDRSINDIKITIETQLAEKIFQHMKEGIQAEIQSQIATQVKQEFAVQIEEHMPDGLLQKQSKETQKQLEHVKNAVNNSEARMKNAAIHSSNLDEPFAVVRNAKGNKSQLWPVDLKSLFAYNLATTSTLVKDFNLTDTEVREDNINRFMAHIGLDLFRLVVPTQEDGVSAPKK